MGPLELPRRISHFEQNPALAGGATDIELRGVDSPGMARGYDAWRLETIIVDVEPQSVQGYVLLFSTAQHVSDSSNAFGAPAITGLLNLYPDLDLLAARAAIIGPSIGPGATWLNPDPIVLGPKENLGICFLMTNTAGVAALVQWGYTIPYTLLSTPAPEPMAPIPSPVFPQEHPQLHDQNLALPPNV